jgi:DNA repair exonuclease SbcCD ATPase subunit
MTNHQDNQAEDEIDIHVEVSNDDVASNEQKIEKLYERLPKIISRITEDNENENVNALNSLLKSFGKINRLEKEALAPGEEHTPLSLLRLYELAVSGGGNASVEELEQANSAFLEENTILAETIESLAFQLDTLKRQSADEVLRTGETPFSLDAVKTSLSDINATISKIQDQVSVLNSNSNHGVAEKPLDERMAEGIGGLNDITADLLKINPAQKNIFKKILGSMGLAYDHKDFSAARQLILTFIKTNRKLAEINATLIPAQEQIQKLTEIVGLVELYAGHEERDGVQYKEAMEEVGRLQNKITIHEDTHGEIEALDQELENKKRDIEEKTIELNDAQSRKEEFFAELNQVKKELTTLEGKHRDQAIELEEKSKTCTELEENVQGLESNIKENNRQHKSEIAIAHNKTRQNESGLLVEKLESEVMSLRQMAEKYETAMEETQQQYAAFEERVEQWVMSSEKSEKEIGKWQKLGSITARLCAAAGGVGLVGGYFLDSVLSINSTGLWGYYGVLVGVPTIITAVAQIKEDEDLEDVVKSSVAAAVIFGLLGTLAIVPGLFTYDNFLVDAKNTYLEQCGDQPCQVFVDEDGNKKIMPLSEIYKDKSIILHFHGEHTGAVTVLDKDNPEETITQQPFLEKTPN